MKRINALICLLVGWWRSFKCMAPVDGCDLVNVEEDVPSLVTTSRCSVCGRWSVEWKRR